MIQNAGESKTDLLKPMGSLLWRARFDLLLLAGSATFFSLFLLGSFQLGTMSGIDKNIATLVAGGAERKASNSKAFNSVGPGALLMNMDAIWVGRGAQAKLKMESGRVLELSEMTLLVLKRHFKPVRQKLKNDDEEFKIITGSVAVDGVPQIPAGDTGAIYITQFPNHTPIGQQQVKIGIYPQDHLLILNRSPEPIELIMTWPKPLTGNLAIQDRVDGRMYYVEINEQRSVPIKLPQGRQYYWQIVDSANSVQLGPFQFELRQLTQNEEVKKLLSERTEAEPVQVFW